MRLRDLLTDVSGRFKPTTYIDCHSVPDEPEGPYRARVTAALDLGPHGVEVCEREIVRGDVQIVYSIRCACGRRWFDTQFERLQVCPKCGRAVLLQKVD